MATSPVLRQPFQAPRPLQRAITAIGREKIIRTDAVLFRQGDPVKGAFLIQSGKIALTLQHSRKNKKCWLADAGSLLGLPATVRKTNYSLTARAVEDTKVAFVSRTKLQRLLLSDPQLCFEAVRVLAAEIRSLRFRE